MFEFYRTTITTAYGKNFINDFSTLSRATNFFRSFFQYRNIGESYTIEKITMVVDHIDNVVTVTKVINHYYVSKHH